MTTIITTWCSWTDLRSGRTYSRATRTIQAWEFPSKLISHICRQIAQPLSLDQQTLTSYKPSLLSSKIRQVTLEYSRKRPSPATCIKWSDLRQTLDTIAIIRATTWAVQHHPLKPLARALKFRVPTSRLVESMWTSICFRSHSWPISPPVSSTLKTRTQTTLTLQPPLKAIISKPLVLTTSTNLRCLTRSSGCPQVHYRWSRKAWNEAHLKARIRMIAKAQRRLPVACRENWDLRPPSSIRYGQVVGNRIWSHAQSAP